VTDPWLSVVIPAFNEAGRLPASLARILAFLRGHAASYEVVVIDDGSRDGTAAAVRSIEDAGLTLLSNPINRGKGYSVRRGMLAARGARRLMTDADLSTPIEELTRLLGAMDAGYDVVVGSRALPESRIEVRQPRYRESMGRVFNALVQVLVLPGIHDTQCGFKLFTAAAAQQAFSRASLDGFAFDVEVLALAQRAGCRLVEVPVVWRNDAASRVGSLSGSQGFLDLLRIRWRLWTRAYARGGPPVTG